MTVFTSTQDSADAESHRVAVVIEDDGDIRNLLETVLTQAGFRVVTAGNGADGVEAVRQNEPVVTTLDVNMPGMDGFETARRIREFSSTYIVMLTALGEEIDAMQGLDSGADDYINKPFRPRELRARIEAMLRRPRAIIEPDAAVPTRYPVAGAPVTAGAIPPLPLPPQPGYAAPPVRAGGQHAAPAEPEPTTPGDDDDWIEHNGLWVNPHTRVVQQEGVEVDLTRSEFDLLVGLMKSTRRVRTKADLVLLLRGESYVTSHFVSDADKRAIEVHMANLRKKLSENPATPRWIETVRGVGYRLTAAETS